MSDTPTPSQAAEKAEMPTIAYLTTDEEGSPAMLFFDAQEAGNYCNLDEQPEELVLRAGAESQLAELRAEVERLSKNDARYRWLRERDWFNSDLCVLREPKRVLTRGIGLGADCPSHSRLDDAIDAALAADGKDGAR